MRVYMYKLTWPCVYRGLHMCAQGCTRFIADFSACDMRVKHMSHACGSIELVANLYRTLMHVYKETCIHAQITCVFSCVRGSELTTHKIVCVQQNCMYISW